MNRPVTDEDVEAGMATWRKHLQPSTAMRRVLEQFAASAPAEIGMSASIKSGSIDRRAEGAEQEAGGLSAAATLNSPASAPVPSVRDNTACVASTAESETQASAPAEDKQAALYDSAYIAGAQHGFRLGMAVDHAGLAAISDQRIKDGYLKTLKASAPPVADAVIAERVTDEMVEAGCIAAQEPLTPWSHPSWDTPTGNKHGSRDEVREYVRTALKAAIRARSEP